MMKEDAGFPSSLRSLRRLHNLRQDEVGVHVGVSIDTIRRWESGEREPRLSDLRKLAALFGVSLDVLTGESTSSRNEEVSETCNQIVFEWSEGADRTLRVVLPPSQEVLAMVKERIGSISGGSPSREDTQVGSGGCA